MTVVHDFCAAGCWNKFSFFGEMRILLKSNFAYFSQKIMKKDFLKNLNAYALHNRNKVRQLFVIKRRNFKGLPTLFSIFLKTLRNLKFLIHRERPPLSGSVTALKKRVNI